MKLLKRMPIKYIGELHDVKLINFSVDQEEIRAFVPEMLKMNLFKGRALISMVNVNLKGMHPSFIPRDFSFSYKHVAFRLLLDDSMYTGSNPRGIYFLKSFTPNKLITFGGKVTTQFNLSTALIDDEGTKFCMHQGEKFVRYEIGAEAPNSSVVESVKTRVEVVDRAYFTEGPDVKYIQVLREHWPLNPINCMHFETNFFETAKLEAAFMVPEVIYYTWLPPQVAFETKSKITLP